MSHQFEFENDDLLLLPPLLQEQLRKFGLNISTNSVRASVFCKKCDGTPVNCVFADNYKPGTCLQLHCTNKNEHGCPNWFLCMDCGGRYINKKRVSDHFATQRHRRHTTSQLPASREARDSTSQLPVGQETTSHLPEARAYSISSFREREASAVVGPSNMMLLADGNNDTSEESTLGMSQASSEEDYEDKADVDEMLEDVVMEEKLPAIYSLEAAFHHLDTANALDLVPLFQDCPAMLFYHAATSFCKLGGLTYMIKRAFDQTEMLWTERKVTPVEAIWHFRNFIQYVSMTSAQQLRQCALQRALNSHKSNSCGFFEGTHLPSYSELSRFYGKSTQNLHALWNILPAPNVTNIGGIGYINPVHAIRYLLAFGTDVDEMIVDFNTSDVLSSSATIKEPSVVCRIAESKVARQFRQSVTDTYDSGVTHPQAQQHKRALCLWVTDWRDGFGSNRTKQNRKSTDAWTLSVATPADRINSISNTVVIAVGLKKNKHWETVEHRFLEDMRELQNGQKPITVYHGGLQKCIPVFVKRFACLTDKVERADYTATLSYASNFHRFFGRAIQFNHPTLQAQKIGEFVKSQRTESTADNLLGHYGWSCSFMEKTVNTARFPSCFSCRKLCVDWLRAPTGHGPPITKCDLCANWVLDERTKSMLSFPAPPNYPKKALPNCFLTPPKGREVNLAMLEYIDLDFEAMKQAARFAFFNSMTPRAVGWNKKVCQIYLRTNGINCRQQELIYAEAKKSFEEYGGDPDTIDWFDDEKVGGYRFPAAWNGDVGVRQFIEMVMHLLFLGVAKSNFKLTHKFLLHCKRPAETFKKTMHELLRSLTSFNLSWLLVMPFNGSTKTKFTTGTWVSENWLAWTRISKVTAAYFTRRGLDDHRIGCDDLIRLLTSFVAVVARILSHAGASSRTNTIIDHLLKEFLSSVGELDIRIRYKTLGIKPLPPKSNSYSVPDSDSDSDCAGNDDGQLVIEGPEKKKAGPSKKATGRKKKRQNKRKIPEIWWLKSNYISCLNVTAAIDVLGPMTNYWDGGGKGERFIQEIKPHIPRGVRDGGKFFVRLAEKVYKMSTMKRIETALADVKDDETSIVSADTTSSSGSGKHNSHQGDDSSAENSTNSDEVQSSSSEDEEKDEMWGSPMEDEQMAKARTFYIYKREAEIRNAVQNVEPVTGIVIKGTDASAGMFLLYKKPGKELGWVKASFQDTEGVSVTGLWYAPIFLEEATRECPQSMSHLQKVARMATVAIPLHYGLGKNHEHASKYCVLTNWWKERDETGRYLLPTLAFQYYQHDTSD